MLLIVLDAGEEKDFQVRRFFISLQHSCTWNANFNQLFAGKKCNKNAVSAAFILVSAVGWCPLEEKWILCKDFWLFVSILWQSHLPFLCSLRVMININNNDKHILVGNLCFTGFTGEVEYF